MAIARVDVGDDAPVHECAELEVSEDVFVFAWTFWFGAGATGSGRGRVFARM